MTRPPNILRPIRLNTTLPEDIRAKLDLLLWSDVESCVPKGAYQKLILALLDGFFNEKSLDLSELSGTIPPERYSVRGKPEAIEQLKALLEK